MADDQLLNSDIQLKNPLYKNDPERTRPGKDADGIVRTPSNETAEISEHNTIIASVEDDARFQALVPIINNLESVRSDLQALYTWTVCAFGKSCLKAAAQGPTGPQGPKGDTGATGPQGAQGIQGPRGNTGAQGDPGWGITMKGEVATEANLPSTGNNNGDAYIVQADDSIWLWTSAEGWISGGSIQGPKGDKGDTGAQGPQGIQGATGATGPRGLKGNTGATGAAGVDGTSGTSGADGATGATGSQGVPGNDGSDGSSGTSGVNGAKGNTGATGATGAQGPRGTCRI